MWEVMYAVNMVYCHWFIEKLLSVNGLTEYIQLRRDIQRESRRSQGEAMQTLQRQTLDETLPSKPQPCGNTQINEDGLVQNIRVSQKHN